LGSLACAKRMFLLGTSGEWFTWEMAIVCVICVCSPRRSSGPFRGGGAAVPQTFDRGHASLSSGGDGQSSVSQPPPRFSRRVESTVIEAQRVTVAAAAAPALTPQSIAVVPAAVVPPPPPPAQLALAEQSNAPPTRYIQSSCRSSTAQISLTEGQHAVETTVIANAFFINDKMQRNYR